MASKTNPVDEPGAFPAREWLRKLVVGKQVQFETRKQGASAGDRVYGWLFLPQQTNDGSKLHLAVECVKAGHATPKAIKFPTTKKEDDGAANAEEPVAEEDDYEALLLKAYQEAKEAGRGIHAVQTVPLVRSIKTAGDDFATLALVEACQKHASQKRITCVIEHVFDGSRFRCQVIDAALPDFQYASFTLLLAGVTSPRIGNPKSDPPTPSEDYAEEARQFVLTRLLQRELPVSLIGTDKVGASAVGMVYHPAGNIAVELLKHGLARMTDWSVRLMPVGDVPALRVAENAAKRSLVGVWHSYAPPVLTTASQSRGTVVEVISGDTLLILPDGKAYTSEDDLLKVSLASIRAPRVGSERSARPDEPYAAECKDRLRQLTVGKVAEITIHYEREIPIQPNVNETRPFATIKTGKHEDISEVLISEGLATTQRHRDDDEKSPRYDELVAAEAAAKAAKKGLHKEGADYKPNQVNDLTDPRKAKAYSGSLMRAGKIKAVVDFVFNGALFKLLIPSENCYIRFSPNFIRCPQPSPSPGSKQNRPAEPFGDEAKRHARLQVLQRQVEISCNGVTNSGIITGSMFAQSGTQKVDYTIELLGAGLATLDQRKVDYGEVPKVLLDAQAAAEQNKVGLWSLARPEAVETKQKSNEKYKETIISVRLSEIRSGSHFFYHVADDDAAKIMEDSMKLFTQNHGTAGAPCDVKVGKVVAALFDDGSGKSWYRAKVLEKKGPSKASVLFLDHGNVATVPVASHLRPLDMSLGTERIPPVAKEAVLALTVTRPLSTDEGVDAARFFQSLCWGKNLIARVLAPDDSGKVAVALQLPDQEDTVNAQLVAEGLARAAKQANVDILAARMADSSPVVKLAAELQVAQDSARKSRCGMWRYGDIGDDDPDEI